MLVQQRESCAFEAEVNQQVLGAKKHSAEFPRSPDSTQQESSKEQLQNPKQVVQLTGFLDEAHILRVLENPVDPHSNFQSAIEAVEQVGEPNQNCKHQLHVQSTGHGPSEAQQRNLQIDQDSILQYGNEGSPKSKVQSPLQETVCGSRVATTQME